MNLPQLPRKAVHPQVEKQDKEIWRPSWKCFCCQDTGIVHLNLAKLVIPDYNWMRDCLPVCQSPKCDLGSRWLHLGNNNLDMRFTSVICQQLDMHEREVWNLTVKRKFINLQPVAKKRSMSGVEDRTENDNREIQQRKGEIEAITSEQWLAMKDEYQRGEKDEIC